MIERADLPLRSTGQREWLERLEAEVGNLAAAVRWCLAHEPAPLPHLFRVLWPFWTIQDSKGELRSWVDQLLPAADSLDPQVQAELAWTAAVAAIDVGDDAATLAARERLALLLASVRDPYLHAVCLLVLGWTGPIAGDLDDALRHASASLARLRDIDEPFWTGISTFTVGFMEVATGRYDDAFRHAREVQELAARFDNDWLTAGSRVLLGTLAVIQGRLDEARELLDEGLALGLAVRSTHHVSLCLNGLARLAAREGDMTRAALLTGAAESLRRRVGMRPWPMLRLMEHDQRAEIRDALGTDLFDEAFAAGARLSYREAVAAGREVSRAVSTGRG
jgi:ATP/maltotriose-dependent transcriptional regulator MalT